MDLLYSPWMRRFLRAVADAKTEILLVSPFIKLSLVRPLLLALPTDRRIQIKVVTRLSKQTFQQLASDVAAIELLHARPGAPGTTSIYRLDRLHAKMYVFDRQLVFLGSSNLSITGMERNLESVLAGADEELARKITDGLDENAAFARQVGAPEFQELRLLLGKEPSALDAPAEGPSPPEDEGALLQQSPVAQEAEAPDTGDEANDVKREREQAIRDFLTTRLRSDLNSLAGIPFESPTIFAGRRTHEGAIEEVRRPTFTEEDRAAAARDLDRIATTLLPLVGATDSGRRDAGLSVFVHQSWCNSFRDLLRDGFQRQHFGSLGSALIDFEISLHFAQQIAFEAASAGPASIATQMAAAEVPYEEILQQKGLNVALHLGNIARTDARARFASLLGLQYMVKGASVALGNLRAMLADELSWRRIDDALEGSKTRLQSVAQSRGLKIQYDVVRSGGTDHEPVFEAHARVGTRRYGPLRASSKKTAEARLATEVLRSLDPNDEYRPRGSRSTWYSYRLDEERRQGCAELAFLLDIQSQASPALLDLALTHPSYVNEHGSSRSYQRLAFVGSYLCPVLVSWQLISALGWQEESYEANRNRNWVVLNRELLPALFDRMDLGRFLRLGKGLAESGPSVSIKRDVVQAMLAVVFHWHGMKGVEKFWSRHFVDAFRDNQASLGELDPISTLQERTVAQAAPRYEVDQAQGRLPHDSLFTARCFVGQALAGTGTGRSKREARKNSAKAALRWLDSQAASPEGSSVGRS